MILDRLPGQKNPVVFAQVNLGVGPAMRPYLYTATFQGGIKGLGFWRDWASRPGKPLLEERPWWPDFPRLSAEIERLMPLIREPHWTAWRALPDAPHVTAATRDYRSDGYLILANHQGQEHRVTVTFEGLPYQPSALQHYFSDKTIAIQAGLRAVIPLEPYGTGVYRLMRLPTPSHSPK